MTNISEGQRFKRYIARIDKFMFNKKKRKEKALASKELLKS